MVTGKWNAGLKSPMGLINATLELAEDGNVLTGCLIDPNGSTEITDGSVNGNEISFKAKLKTPMGAMSVNFTGTVNGDVMTGKAKMMMGAMDFTATRA